MLDMAAKLDDTADYLCTDKWKVSEFPAPFGRLSWPEEEYIKVGAPLTEALSVEAPFNHRGAFSRVGPLSGNLFTKRFSRFAYF